MAEQVLQNYSTKNISTILQTDIEDALKSIRAYGSVEIYVQNSIVTQITVRDIKKTNSRA